MAAHPADHAPPRRGDARHDPLERTAPMPTGTAAGVPYVALPPTTGRADAPLVVAWHLLDPPRTPEAFAPTDGG